jgi:hypothetical protein
VQRAHAARRQAPEPAAEPPAPRPRALAVLHTQREVERVVPPVWHRGACQSEAAVTAEAQREQAKRRGPDPRGVAGQAGRAWRPAARLWEEAGQAQEAVEQRQEALGWCEASGHLEAREPAQTQRHQARPRLQGDGWQPANRRLRAARPRRHGERRHEPWRSASAEPR